MLFKGDPITFSVEESNFLPVSGRSGLNFNAFSLKCIDAFSYGRSCYFID